MAGSQTSSRRGKAAAKRDRLSALPDGVLHRVLRFLDARHTVSVLSHLSRRWRHLWASSSHVALSDPDHSERFGSSLSSSSATSRRRCAPSASTSATASPSPTTAGGFATPSAATSPRPPRARSRPQQRPPLPPPRHPLHLRHPRGAHRLSHRAS
ncbi:unnamed protein product [Urochloa humidicola]